MPRGLTLPTCVDCLNPMKKGIVSLSWLAIAALSFALVACGGSDEKKKDSNDRKEKARVVASKVSALQARIDQLEDTLEQLDRETEIQQNRISAAKGDLAVIRETIDAAEAQTAHYLDRASSQTAIARKIRDSRREDDRKQEREEAENSTLSTVLLLCFLAIVIIFGGKLWRDRSRATEGMDVSEGMASGSGASYTYPASTPEQPPQQQPDAFAPEETTETTGTPNDTKPDEENPTA